MGHSLPPFFLVQKQDNHDTVDCLLLSKYSKIVVPAPFQGATPDFVNIFISSLTKSLCIDSIYKSFLLNPLDLNGKWEIHRIITLFYVQEFEGFWDIYVVWWKMVWVSAFDCSVCLKGLLR